MQKIEFPQRQILDVKFGLITQFREVATWQPMDDFDIGVGIDDEEVAVVIDNETDKIVARSRFEVGEVVAIAQPYKDVLQFEQYRNTRGWSNRRFVDAEQMPHKIRITHIWAERYSYMSDCDCLRSGVIKSNFLGDFSICGLGVNSRFTTAKDAYNFAFRKFHPRIADRVFENDPVVFVYNFEYCG